MRTSRRVDAGIDCSADWQDHCSRRWHGAFRHVHAGLTLGGGLPAQQQSAEAVRKVREMVLKAGATLVSDNVYALELANGSRVKALPGSDDSVRGLTVDAWIVADEAATPDARIDRCPAADACAASAMHDLSCYRRPGAAPIRSGPRGKR